MTARQAYRHLKQALAFLEEREAEAEARGILLEICGVSVQQLLLEPAREILPEQEQALRRTVCLRAGGEPLAYVLGTRAFYGLRFSVSPQVLIPRQETELLVERCIALIEKEGVVKALDLCTGSGCIAICLALYSGAQIFASDLSAGALRVARRNAQRLGAEVRFMQADMLERMEGRYGLIVSNPPYLSDEEYAAMEEGIKNSEPALALRGGADGLDFYRRIAKQAPANLEPGGHLALEIGCGQAEDVCRLLRQTGFDKIEVFQDYAGLDRMVFARI